MAIQELVTRPALQDELMAQFDAALRIGITTDEMLRHHRAELTLSHEDNDPVLIERHQAAIALLEGGAA